MPRLHPLHAALVAAFAGTSVVHAQTPAASEQELATITVEASADASAEGLPPAYAGGQVARGGRAGILGTRDNMDTPFSITSYTNELIQDRQARSVGDVLQNDPSVRVARGFGNFQESYFIRGFILNSDDVAYNGLYSLLPRQYIATELFERVEVLRGASAFLIGANPGGGGIGGAVNLLPKRAPNEPLTRLTAGIDSGGQASVATDIARRFGPDQATGIRLNAALKDGDTAVDNEKAKLGLLALGLDWRSRDVRLSGDIGWQDNKLKSTRPNVTLSGVNEVPDAPDASSNFAQPWSYSNEKDLFGTFRGEFDITPDVTAWSAYGFRRSDEANSLANLTVTDSATGAGNAYRFDNAREDKVDTAELGLRGKLQTGSVGHEWVASASYFELESRNAYVADFGNTLPTNLYAPTFWGLPAYSGTASAGGSLSSPLVTHRVRLTSVAVGDTMSFLDNRFLLTLGARHQSMKIDDYDYNSGVKNSAYSKSRVSPMVGAVYKLSPKLSLYGNYIEGLTQGEEAAGTPPPANLGEVLPPYVSKQKEVGVKFDGGRFGGGVALFHTTKPRSLITDANIFTAQGEDRHQGIEINAFGEPTRGLRLLGGLTLLDAKQKTTNDAATEGKRVIGVPRAQATLGAEWDVPGVRGLTLDGRVAYTGSVYADSDNTLKVPSWTRFDLGARYLTEVQGRVVTLRANIQNVADRNYWASVGGSGYLVLGAPRTFMLSATIDF